LVERIAKSQQPALVAVDYAEARPGLHRELEALTRHALDHGGLELRVALLARSADDWWRHLGERAGEGLRSVLEQHGPLQLFPVRVEQGHRALVFDHAHMHLARALGMPEGTRLSAAAAALTIRMTSRGPRGQKRL
jgi:hypothetical protein